MSGGDCPEDSGSLPRLSGESCSAYARRLAAWHAQRSSAGYSYVPPTGIPSPLPGSATFASLSVVPVDPAANRYRDQPGHHPDRNLRGVLRLVHQAIPIGTRRRVGIIHLFPLRISGADNYRHLLPRTELGVLLVALRLALALKLP